MDHRGVIREKMKESAQAVLPLAAIVFLLCLFFVPVKSGLTLSFLIGTALIIAGMALFTIGADSAMTQIGSQIGAQLTASRRLGRVVGLSFLLGVIITVAEPDLQVLATCVPDIDTGVLIFTVSAGVGLFLTVSMLRILFRVPFQWLLIGLYALVFALAALTRPGFLAVAFDSGGVTTGPMTVPFIMALGAGVAAIRSDEGAKADGFGLIALCSIGPILAVMILGFIYRSETADTSEMILAKLETSVDIGFEYLKSFPGYMGEVAVALLPILAFFAVFQVFSLKMDRAPLVNILVGLVFTYVGLVLFLTGVNVGFSALGYVLGGVMVEEGLKWLIVPLGVVLGWFIIRAEPAVHVLTRQVSEFSAGAITEKSMARTLSVAIALANGLAMIRVLTGASIWWFVVAGYAAALALTFFVPPTFTAIAFDAGGVASGPMTAAFMLPLAMGVSHAVGGNVMTDAFGLVALVALMPLITVQTLGAVAVFRGRRTALPTPGRPIDDEIIELWEVM